MPTCRCEHPNRHRLGILKQARQVADHSTRSFGQSPQDRLVQILRDNITEPAGNLKDGYLTYRVLSGPYLPTSGRTGGRWCWQIGRDAGHIPGREPDDVVFEICGKGMRAARLLGHAGLNSVVLECKDTGHQGSGVARR